MEKELEFVKEYCKENGADVLVAGSAFFGADDKKVAIDNLNSALNA